MELGLSRSLCSILLVFLFVGLSSSAFIADDVFESSHAAAGSRNLLQALKACKVNFKAANYTIITSQCKRPNYTAKTCCKAFEEFACPYADAINDLTTDCAIVMFKYINQHGKYPPGLFAALCKEGKKGLECPPKPSLMSDNSNASIINAWDPHH